MSPEEQIKIKETIGVDCPIEMDGCIKADEGNLLRIFIKAYKPFYIVESGSGVSTFYILKALQELGKGRLISVDKYKFNKQPKYQKGHDFSKRKIWIIPIIKKHFSDVNWKFIDNVDSVEYLKSSTDTIDFFFHDSCHLLEHIDKELELVKNNTKWYGAHNFRNKITESYFKQVEFKKQWRIIGLDNQLGIWEKTTEGKGVKCQKN